MSLKIQHKKIEFEFYLDGLYAFKRIFATSAAIPIILKEILEHMI